MGYDGDNMRCTTIVIVVIVVISFHIRHVPGTFRLDGVAIRSAVGWICSSRSFRYVQGDVEGNTRRILPNETFTNNS